MLNEVALQVDQQPTGKLYKSHPVVKSAIYAAVVYSTRVTETWVACGAITPTLTYLPITRSKDTLLIKHTNIFTE